MTTSDQSWAAHYAGTSPQLVARIAQSWSANNIDLERLMRLAAFPPVSASRPAVPMRDSRPVDRLMVFDQACLWVDCLHAAALAGHDRSKARGDLAMSGEQWLSLGIILGRILEEAAAIRLLVRSGLAMPATQIARSMSEDVDMALIVLIRRKLAKSFLSCQTTEEANGFWRRHIAGGRAVRTVTEALYRSGLDYPEDGDYAQWRRDMLAFLGTAVHTTRLYPTADRRAGALSADGPSAESPTGQPGPFSLQAQSCLYFATLRLQELCAYLAVLGGDLDADLRALLSEAADQAGDTADEDTVLRLRFALTGRAILFGQMRWLIDNADDIHAA